jgi:hypothetical protein
MPKPNRPHLYCSYTFPSLVRDRFLNATTSVFRSFRGFIGPSGKYGIRALANACAGGDLPLPPSNVLTRIQPKDFSRLRPGHSLFWHRSLRVGGHATPGFVSSSRQILFTHPIPDHPDRCSCRLRSLIAFGQECLTGSRHERTLCVR